ncbi:MAG: acyltransferase family protein [Candidatus Berkelbacteria bacterium]
MNKRIDWVDTAKGITIFLVVLGHTILPYNWLIYVFSFHMPMFFFLSGYLYNPEKYQNLWSLIKRKAGTLLWPYLFFFIFNFIYWVLFFNSKQYFDPIIKMIYSTDTLSAPFIPLWFLTCLFALEIIFFTLERQFKSFKLFLAIIVCTITGFILANNHYHLPWGIDIALVSTSFYYLGFIIKKNDLIEKTQNVWLYLLGLIFIIINYFLAFLLDIQASMFYRAYGQEWLFVLTAIFGILGYIILAKFLKQTILKNNTIIEFLGQNSLIILGLHTVFYYYVSDFFRIFLHIYPKTSTIFAFIYTIITILLICPFIIFINKKAPFLIGRKPTSKNA